MLYNASYKSEGGKESIMPPKTKVTRDMIVLAAVDVARQDGVDKINARTVA